ncbi:MAG: glycosyltransferase family 4 protein [Syntrophobacteraceae bacterium]|nr:glycosyltransferase family 4 protein [Syntrophobacteraceae bacterium]
MEKVALTLMGGLRDCGHEVFCVASAWTDGDFPTRLTRLSIPYEQVYLGKLTKSLRHTRWMADTLAYWPGARLKVRGLLNRFQPDVVLLYQLDHLVLIHGLLKRRRCLFHVHSLLPSGGLWRILLPWTDQVVHRYAAVSRFVQDQLVNRGIAAEKCCMVYNGLDRAATSPGAERDLPAPVRIGIVGQVGAWKGHLDFVEALALLNSKDLPFEGHIYGEGSPEFKALLRRKIEVLGLNEKIVWHGYVKDTDAIYGSLDIVSMPSIHEEPLGLIPCEAGLRGLPAVVTRQGGLPEIVEDGETGFIVDAGRPDQLADRLERLTCDSDLRRGMGEKARLRIAERFSRERMVSEFESLCRELVAHA